MPFVGDVVPYLAALGMRSLALAAIALAAIYLLRVKAAAARHAVWSAVMAGMLLLPAFSPLFPGIPLRILRPSPSRQLSAEPVAAVRNGAVTGLPAVPAPLTRRAGEAMRPAALIRHPLTWPQAAAAVYFAVLAVFLCMLASGYRLARRLVSASRPVEGLGGADIFESSWIAVPVTVGFLRPKILLPEMWREWPAEKLAAVLVHERTHVERADWAIAVAAGLNRRLFWFHPLAWWLERHLAVLAERACDDAALLALGAREAYAQTLLEMAAAVQTGRGRMVGEAMAMAKTAEVRKRIERILDETRPIPHGLTRARWVTLAACSLPLVYLASVTQLAPAQQLPLAPQAVSPPQQPVLPKPESLTMQSTPPVLVRSHVPFRRMFAAPGKRRFFFHDTPHADPIVMPPPALDEMARKTARRTWYFVFNNQELEQLKSAAMAPGMNLAFVPQLAPPAAASLQANFRVEVDASAQAPYPYRLPMVAPLLHKVDPIYPAQARAAGIHGDVKLSVVIGTDGHVLSVRPLAGDPLLAAAAMDAVKQYIYQPTTLRNGERAEIETTVTIPFRLDGNADVTQDAGQPAAQPSAGNSPPRLTYKVEPEYPMEARAAQRQGTVKLSIAIGSDGLPKNPSVLQSAGFGLDEQALNAVRQWRFKPAYRDGHPVEYVAIVEVTFRLQ